VVRQDGVVRIVSLLPSATEIAFLLGLGDQLVGVTHECDWPPEASSVRRVSWSNLPPLAEPAEVDRLVSESVTSGASIYELDRAAIRELQPDLILTQDLCEVCAVPAGHLRAALDVIGCDAEVVSLDPSSLDEVLDCILTVAKSTGTEPVAQQLVGELQSRLAQVGASVTGRPRPRTLALEWGDPPYNGGHWVPEMIDVAGGEALLASRGIPSTRLAWPDIAATKPETVVFMPCGYDLEAACAEATQVVTRAELQEATCFIAANASAYFSRPGPRLVDGVEALASLLHPGRVTPRVTDAVTVVPASP
jgi:iron complex transport system substrate-binding protein